MAATSFSLNPVASGAGIDGGTNENWQLDGNFVNEGPFSKWIIEKWKSLDGAQKQERRVASEYELPSIILDNQTLVTSAKLTATLSGKWGSAGLLSYLQTYAYIGNGSFEATDLNDLSLKVAETDPNSMSTGSMFTIDLTNYINNLNPGDSNTIGLVLSIYGFTDRIDFQKDLKLDIEFEPLP